MVLPLRRCGYNMASLARDQIQYVDVNGDRKADAIYFDVLRSREVWVSVSNGSGFTGAVPWPHAP